MSKTGEYPMLKAALCTLDQIGRGACASPGLITQQTKSFQLVACDALKVLPFEVIVESKLVQCCLARLCSGSPFSFGDPFQHQATYIAFELPLEGLGAASFAFTGLDLHRLRLLHLVIAFRARLSSPKILILLLTWARMHSKVDLQVPPELLWQEALLRPAPRKLLLMRQLALVWARLLRRPSFGLVALLQMVWQALKLLWGRQVLAALELDLLEEAATIDCLYILASWSRLVHRVWLFPGNFCSAGMPVKAAEELGSDQPENFASYAFTCCWAPALAPLPIADWRVSWCLL